MDTAYSTKAELYDKYRWDYPIQAVEYIKKTMDLNENSIVADIGAGTGILTKHFIPFSGKVYAIEPDDNMFDILSEKFNSSNLIKIQSTSDKLLSIPDHSLDMIISSHAINWFEYEKTILEFNRILKKTGHLVTLTNESMISKEYHDDLNNLIKRYASIDNRKKLKEAIHDYYIDDSFTEKEYFFTWNNTFEYFLGSLMSVSFLPDHHNEDIKSFEDAAREIFDKYSKNSIISFQCKTSVIIGSLKKR